MKNHVQKTLRLIINRIFVTVVLILLQLSWMLVLLFRLSEYSTAFSVLFSTLSIIMVLYVICKDDNSAYKIGWIILIMTFPLFGGMFYLCFGDKKPSKRLRKKLNEQHNMLITELKQDEFIIKGIEKDDTRAAQTCRYIQKYSEYPVYGNTKTSYYAVGEEMFKDMITELENAKKFIFIEYFIICEGQMWNTILEILKRKASQGVDVRIIYDDIGCVALLPPGYSQYIESLDENIQCLAFNPFVPFFSLVMNNRDHRKMMIIDGKTAFSGGVNLSDEYINIGSRYGHWKDTGIRLVGDAVWNFTEMFLETWRAFKIDDVDISTLKPDTGFECSGFVQPFCDTPLEDETLAENIYIEILNQAEKYVYIYTPYLIIDNEMKSALCLAAKRGVDVRIVTPGIPDKKLVYRLTRSNYLPLLKAGVKILEYSPGFIHAKSYICDDKFAIVGTINMDYRSLYLHFECGTFMYKTEAVMMLKQDCIETFKKCRVVDINNVRKGFRGGFGRLLDAILRILSPLL